MEYAQALEGQHGDEDMAIQELESPALAAPPAGGQEGKWLPNHYLQQLKADILYVFGFVRLSIGKIESVELSTFGPENSIQECKMKRYHEAGVTLILPYPKLLVSLFSNSHY